MREKQAFDNKVFGSGKWATLAKLDKNTTTGSKGTSVKRGMDSAYDDFNASIEIKNSSMDIQKAKALEKKKSLGQLKNEVNPKQELVR